MAWDNAPWALDGTLTKSELARRAQYAATGGAEGVVGIGDLKVIPLAVPGNGFRISVGGAQILNRYTTPLNQTYVASNPTIETVDSTRTPAVNAAIRSHLVVATVGDPQYSPTGHPWMPADMVGQNLNTFQYVRSWIIPNVPASTTRFDQLGLNYPGLALARIDLPAGSTTYGAAQIVDLRQMAAPRTKDVQWNVATSVNDVLFVTTPGTFEYWPDNSQAAVEIPTWASYAYVDGWVNGFSDATSDLTKAEFRIGSAAMGVYTPSSKYSSAEPGRKNVLMGGRIYVPPAYRGTTQNWQISATPQDAASQSDLTTDLWTNCMVHIRFAEEAD